MIYNTETCPICFDSHHNEKVLECRHVLCRKCYKEYIKTYDKCPLCRMKIQGVKKRTEIPIEIPISIYIGILIIIILIITKMFVNILDFQHSPLTYCFKNNNNLDCIEKNIHLYDRHSPFHSPLRSVISDKNIIGFKLLLSRIPFQKCEYLYNEFYKVHWTKKRRVYIDLINKKCKTNNEEYVYESFEYFKYGVYKIFNSIGKLFPIKEFQKPTKTRTLNDFYNTLLNR